MTTNLSQNYPTGVIPSQTARGQRTDGLGQHTAKGKQVSSMYKHGQSTNTCVLLRDGTWHQQRETRQRVHRLCPDQPSPHPMPYMSRLPLFHSLLRAPQRCCNRQPNAALLVNHYHPSAASRDDGSGTDDRVILDADGQSSSLNRRGILPGIQRIILIRHGESLGNIDERAYTKTADWRIPLTAKGREQARSAGRRVASHLMGGDGSVDGSVDGITQGDVGVVAKADGTKGKVFFYVSPYLRTRQTLREMLREVDAECIAGIREDPRM